MCIRDRSKWATYGSDTRPRKISSQNTCVWVSFSTPTRTYTQNRLGRSLLRAGVATGKKFCCYCYCCTPAITENAQAHEMRIDGRAFYLVNDLNEPPTDRICIRERLVPKTLVFGFPFPHRHEHTHTQNRLGRSLLRAGVATGKKYCYYCYYHYSCTPP